MLTNKDELILFQEPLILGTVLRKHVTNVVIKFCFDD